MEEIRFPYKPKIITYIFILLLFGGAGYFFIYEAFYNDRGLIINGFIEFSTTGATIFYGALAFFSLAFCLVGIITIIRGITLKREIILREKDFTSPKSGISNKEITLNYADISSVSVQELNSNKTLIIVHSNGKLTIPHIMLPNKKTFNELTSTLIEKVNRFNQN